MHIGFSLIIFIACSGMLIGINLIKDLANEIDGLTTSVVEKALNVSSNPGDQQLKEELDALRQEWAGKVQELTRVIDDIIDPEDFMAQSGDSLTLSDWLIRFFESVCLCALYRGQY